MQYIGFWWRVPAFLIDYLLIFIVTIGLAVLFLGMLPQDMVQVDVELSYLEILLLKFANAFMNNLMWFMLLWPFFTSSCVALFEAVFVASPMQATPGKRLFGFIVVNEQGERLSFWRGLGRGYGKVLSMAVMWGGYIMVAFTNRKQGLHDVIAKTLVIKRRQAASG